MTPLRPMRWWDIEPVVALEHALFDDAWNAEMFWDELAQGETRTYLVATDGDDVVGWVALTGYSDRCCYQGVADLSVYVDPAVQGRGVGRALLEHLVRDAERAGIWTLQAGVFPENAASLALHERCGFRVVGTRERIGKLDGVWRDVVLLERRSPVVA